MQESKQKPAKSSARARKMKASNEKTPHEPRCLFRGRAKKNKQTSQQTDKRQITNHQTSKQASNNATKTRKSLQHHASELGKQRPTTTKHRMSQGVFVEVGLGNANREAPLCPRLCFRASGHGKASKAPIG